MSYVHAEGKTRKMAHTKDEGDYFHSYWFFITIFKNKMMKYLLKDELISYYH